MKGIFYTLLFWLCFVSPLHRCLGQEIIESIPDSIAAAPFKKKVLVGTVSGLSAGLGLWGLGNIWYKGFGQSKFHFFNDLPGWNGVDKLGHALSTYQISRISAASWRWAGYNTKKSALLGSAIGWGLVTTVEYFDGRSAEWGASVSDVVANTLGVGLFAFQELHWKEQRISLKWTYYPSKYAQYYPDRLGVTWQEQLFKDYNGHTYWLSGNIASFIKKETWVPSWLNIAVGYGADGMLRSIDNPWFAPDGTPLPRFPRYNQWYLSFDIDTTRIKTKSKVLRTILFGLNFIKFPMPTLGYDGHNGMDFYWLF